MQVSLVTKHGTIFYAVDGEISSCDLIFQCSPSQWAGTLEIGKRHVFEGQKMIRFGGRRRCDFELRVRRRTDLSEEAVTKLNLNDDKIGEITFCSDYKAEDGAPSIRASLDAIVFVSDHLFEDLATSLQAGRKVESIYLEIEKEGVVEYGWEPDGSRKIWKIENPEEPSAVDVTSLEIAFTLF